MVNEDDFDDLIAVGEEEREQLRKEKRNKEIKAILRNVGVLLLIVAVGFAVFFGVTSYNEYQREQERLAIEAAREEITLQNVNVEQVEWADQTCSVVNSWRYEQFPVYLEEAEPFTAKGEMATSLRENASRMRQDAEEISVIPFTSHQSAQERVNGVTLVDNFKVVGYESDRDTANASQTIAASLNDYAQSMEDMATDLEDTASYDFNGMRTQIERVGNFMAEMDAILEEDFTSVMTLELFDNAVTLDEIASLESCNENMVSQDYVEENYGEEIRNQRVLEDIVVSDRCYALLDNNELVQQTSEITDEDEPTESSETTTSEEDAPEEGDESVEDSATEEEGDDANATQGDGDAPADGPTDDGAADEDANDEDSSSTTSTTTSEDPTAVPAEGTNENVLRNIQACENFLTVTVIDNTHPVHDMVINTVEEEMALPDLRVHDQAVELTEGDTDEEGESDGEESTSTESDDANSEDSSENSEEPAEDTNPDNE